MFLVHITNPKSFVFNFWGSLQLIPAAGVFKKQKRKSFVSLIVHALWIIA